MTKPYIYIGIILLTSLLGLGAFWQHNRYVALNQRFESLQEDYRGLAEASEKASKVSTVKDKSSTDKTFLILESNKATQKQVAELARAVQKGNTSEKALMSSPLPPDVVRVLDDAYEDRSEVGTYP
jgi:hypothetical protein